ncbi:MAG TPA: TolC family protein [Bryobacteraceae bacterium]|jgi:outer membrane protein TolC|nr:TolC family protein [Bryobacteraceae bacterium]
MTGRNRTLWIRRPSRAAAALAAWLCAASQMPAQNPPAAALSSARVDRPSGTVLLRPYRGVNVPESRSANSSRLHSLIRAGKLYLTAADAIALAIENNLDLEVDRYGPFEAEWNVERAEAGGPLRGVTGGNTVVNQAQSGQGVLGSEISAGLANGGNGGGNGSGNAIVSQIGPVTSNLDAVMQNTMVWSHASFPQENTVVSQTPTLVDTRHTYTNAVQQGLLTGGYLQVSANEYFLEENAPSNALNPSVAPVVQVFLRHNLLQGFGTGVNGRFIRVAKKNVGLADETFRSQLLNTVSSVLNAYWDLVSDNEDLRTKQGNLAVAQKFYDDTKTQIGLGVLARVEIYRAEGELHTRRRDSVVAETAVRQQENLLKNMISLNGLADPLLDAATIVPLDSIEIPAQEDLPPLRELVAHALAKRPDVAIDNITAETEKISAAGTRNGILPSLQVLTAISANGLAGRRTPQPPDSEADPYFEGGLGTALGQIFRNNFPTQRGAVLFQGEIHNHLAQGDYGIDQLQLRQNDLIRRRNRNQLVVDISNQMVALKQARARYAAAVDAKKLQEELLEKEQQRFSLGASTINDVITVQRSLADAQSTEIAAKTIYSHARVSLDQVLGDTLEKNHVSVEDARSGRVERASSLPANTPGR